MKEKVRMKILVVGKGGREHALLRSFKESATEAELFCYPGSDAIAQMAWVVDGVSGVEELVEWMQKEKIDLCVAGEESYLVTGEGLANLCKKAGIPCWGPVKEAAQLEASKSFAKAFLERHQIATGSAQVVDSVAAARAVIGGKLPTVLKFDGLAAGKGVAVCFTEDEVEEFLDEVFTTGRFGEGDLLIEEFLEGPEVSIFAAVVDDKYLIFTPARDYKRIGEGDTGPNTGGMGAVAGQKLISPSMRERIEKEIVAPTVAGLVADNLPYRGFLYFGLMITEQGPKVIEYNCRFGDPECQAVMPLVKGDLVQFCYAGAQGDFRPSLLEFDSGWGVCVVLASAGYPEGSRAGDVIHGLDKAGRVDHSGTRLNENGEWETNGGRVLAVVASGENRVDVVREAQQAAAQISFADAQWRCDVGTMHFEEEEEEE